MTRLEVLNKQLDEIMDSFDFNKASKMMSAVNWKWATVEGVPDEYDLRKQARSLMKQAIAKEGCSTGGFSARVIDGVEDNKPWTKLDLSFGIDSGFDGEFHD